MRQVSANHDDVKTAGDAGGWLGHNRTPRERADDLRDKIAMWIGEKRLDATLRRDELAQLEGFQRVLALRNGILYAAIRHIRMNQRADSTLGVLTLIGFLCDNGDGLCRIGVQRMADIFKRSRQAMTDTIHRLEALDSIGVIRSPGMSDAYWIKVPVELAHIPAGAADFVRALSDRQTQHYQRAYKQEAPRKSTGAVTPQVDLLTTPQVDLTTPRKSTGAVTPQVDATEPRKSTDSTIYPSKVVDSSKVESLSSLQDSVVADAPTPAPTTPKMGTHSPVAKPKKPVSTRKRFPEGWSPGDDGYAYARSLGIRDPERLFEAFADFHQSKGNAFVDWLAAWRTWCRNEIKFSAGRGPPPRSAINSVKPTQDFEDGWARRRAQLEAEE